jgi:6-pyruvoyltetrahydropterin/6-carboxytetrahydropterin synthase
MHGHNYVVFFEAELNTFLDSIGRVVDFSVLKERLGGWINDNWDHGFLYFANDPECVSLFKADERFITNKNYVCPFNPTAENMANFLLREISPRMLVGTAVTVTKVTVWETENCFATATL